MNEHVDAGSAGFKGYDYQIIATVWVALELFLGQQHSTAILIEPVSREDIEATLIQHSADAAESNVAALNKSERLYIQIKHRSTGPWDMSSFAGVLVGDRSGSDDKRSRKRPDELLQQDPLARFALLTDAAVGESLMPYTVSSLIDRHTNQTLPPSIKSRSGLSDEVATRFSILSTQTEELLNFRIRDLLSTKGFVPSLRLEDCVIALRHQVRERLLGHLPAEWGLKDVSSLVGQFGGAPFLNPRLAEYVEPLSYSKIEDQLHARNAILLIGPPGTGKTLTSEIIAARYARLPAPYNVVRQKSPEKIRDLLTEAGRFLFLLSDPWGANKVDGNAPVNWTDELPKLLEFSSPDKRFIVTTRTDVLRSALGEKAISGTNKNQFLSGIAVRLLPDDYNIELRRQILRNKAARLLLWQREYASRHEREIVSSLLLPYSIEQFVFHLGEVQEPRGAQLQALLDSADLDAVANTVRAQVHAWGPSYLECSTITWALLATSDSLSTGTVTTISSALGANGIVLELNSFIKHLTAGGNVDERDNAIEAHPKVIAALEQVLKEKPATASCALRDLMSAVAPMAHSDSDLGELLYKIARLVRSDSSPIHFSISIEAQQAIHGNIKAKLGSPEPALFLGGLREATEAGLPGNLGMLVQHLADTTKRESRLFRQWRSPEAASVSEEFTTDIVNDPISLNTLNMFIEFALPQNDLRYPAGAFLAYVGAFPTDLSAAFGRAFDAIVEREQVSFNDDVVVAGMLQDGAQDVDVAYGKILQLWDSIDSWFERSRDQLTAVRECELDVAYSAHLEEEPSERYAVVEGLAQAYVRERRKREGWRWLAVPESERFGQSWAAALAEPGEEPTSDEWDALMQSCRRHHMRDYWTSVKTRKAVDRFEQIPVETFASKYAATEFIEALLGANEKESINILQRTASSLEPVHRATMVIALSGMSLQNLGAEDSAISKASTLETVKSTAASIAEAELLAALAELTSEAEFNLIRGTHGTAPTATFLEIARSSRNFNEHTAAVLALLCSVLGESDFGLLEELMTSDDRDVTRIVAVASAVSGSESLLHDGLSHKHYRVRRTALQALCQNADAQVRRKLIGMAQDKSAAVRLEVARTIGKLGWGDGVETLVSLLADDRDYNDDALTSGWPHFEVARSAAYSLQQIGTDENLSNTILAFLKRGRKASADPILHANLVSALSGVATPDVLSFLVGLLNNPWHIGGEPVPRYVLRCAAAEGIARCLSTSSIGVNTEQTEAILGACQAPDPALAARAIVAAAIAFNHTAPLFSSLVASHGIPVTHTVLYIVAALAHGASMSHNDVKSLLSNTHPLFPLIVLYLQTGAVPEQGSTGLQVGLEGLKQDNEIERATLYCMNEWCGWATSGPESPWKSDLEPERIRTLTVRSLAGDE